MFNAASAVSANTQVETANLEPSAGEVRYVSVKMVDSWQYAGIRFFDDQLTMILEESYNLYNFGVWTEVQQVPYD